MMVLLAIASRTNASGWAMTISKAFAMSEAPKFCKTIMSFDAAMKDRPEPGTAAFTAVSHFAAKLLTSVMLPWLPGDNSIKISACSLDPSMAVCISRKAGDTLRGQGTAWTSSTSGRLRKAVACVFVQ